MKTKQNLTTVNFQFKKLLSAVFILFLTTASLFAQSVVDPTFDVNVSKDQNQSSSPSMNLKIQPDGKILVFGNFNIVNGKSKSKIVRLNSDGTLDNSFNCVCANFSQVGSAIVQPDGRIVIGGTFGAGPSSRIARLHTDGSIDDSFVSPYDPVNIGSLAVWAIQPDGKILLTRTSFGPFFNASSLERLNSTGSIDNTFSTPIFDHRGSKDVLSRLVVLSDGKILIGGKRSSDYLFRLNTDGTKDTSFESPTLTNSIPQIPPYIADFGFQSDGKLVVSGGFITINGVSRTNFARLNTNGSVDLTFSNALQPQGEFRIVSGDKIQFGYLRANADGTLDKTFNQPSGYGNWELDSQERLVLAVTNINGVTTSETARLNTDGSIDNTFNSAYFGFSGEVNTLGLQADGKVLINGNFTRVNNVAAPYLVRVNSDGSLDTGFNSTGEVPPDLTKILVQPDGKILIGSSSNAATNPIRQGLARLNADGSVDTTFDAAVTGGVNEIALQPDGRILIGGVISNVGGVSRTGIARLNSDGSLDNSFNPMFGSVSISAIVVQADGKIAVGGSFNGVNGFNRQNFTRLNSDGSLDTGFNAGSIGSVSQIAQLPDGKYYVNSGFITILRRNSDGTADASFSQPTIQTSGTNGFLKRFVLQSDGDIVIVGRFDTVNSTTRNNIARIRPNGFVDTLFFTSGTNDRINAIVAQTDGKYIIGGNFYTVEFAQRAGIARISAPAFHRVTLFDYDGDGKADISVFRPSENKWYVLRSSDSGVTQQVFAIAGDVPVPADYDGDGKTDFAIFRPSSGDWWSLYSSSGVQAYAHWGQTGDITRPGDFNGDGRADYIVFRPADNYWYRINSANGAGSHGGFGLAGDKPVIGDFDGDGKVDKAIFRPSTGDWWWQSSIDNVHRATHWGISTDLPAPADYDGDGKTDFAVFRPSEGNWYVFNSSDFSFTILHWGIAEDKPVPADYDGDGKADISVFRPSTGVWYLLRTTQGFTELPFGASTDIPTPYSFVQ